MTFVTSYFLFIQSWNLNYLYLFELLNLNIFWVRSFLNKCFIVWKHFLKHNFVVYYIFISIHFCHKVVYVRNSFQVWDICLLELSFWNFCLNESSVKDWVRILIYFVYFYFHIKHVYYLYKVSFFHSDVQNQKNYTRLTPKFLIKVRHLSNPVFNFVQVVYQIRTLISTIWITGKSLIYVSCFWFDLSVRQTCSTILLLVNNA